MQAETGELLGKAARWSDIPSVKAYRGPLPEGSRGIEFVTQVEPYWDAHPTLVRWLIGMMDVRTVSDGVVAINVRVTRNTQV